MYFKQRLKKNASALAGKILLVCSVCYSSFTFALEQNSFNQEALLLPFVHVEVRPNINKSVSEQNLDSSEILFGGDILYSASYKKTRLLTEYFFSSEEFDLERLQLGYELNPETTVWLGRFHTPLGYWSSQFHHGLHLQTSVHRPGIIEYEDDGGILSNRMTGILLDGDYHIDDSILHYAAAFGTAPVFEDGSLTPWINSDNKRKHSGQGTFRLAYQPDELNPSQFGAFINIDRINARDAKLKYVDQLVTGLFAHMDWNNARITTAGYYVDDRLKEIDRTHSSGFLAAYLHAEYELGFKWTGYARVERTAGGQHDEYMEYFGDPNLERNLVGIRFDITRRQAISSEISQRLNEHDSHTHISLQWSAVFP